MRDKQLAQKAVAEYQCKTCAMQMSRLQLTQLSGLSHMCRLTPTHVNCVVASIFLQVEYTATQHAVAA